MQILLGGGIGLTMSPATNLIMNSLPAERAGIGSAMNDTTRQLGGALGVAVLGALMNGIYRSEVDPIASLSGVSETMMATVRSSVQSAHLLANEVSGSLASAITQTSSLAFVDGMKQSLLIGSLFMVAAAIAAWKLIPSNMVPFEEKALVSE